MKFQPISPPWASSGLFMALMTAGLALSGSGLGTPSPSPSPSGTSLSAPTIAIGQQQRHIYAKVEVDAAGNYTLIQRKERLGKAPGRELEVTSRPLTVIEHKETSDDRLLEITAATDAILDEYLSSRGIATTLPAPSPLASDEEVVTLIDNGPTKNRVDIILMGDGYTEDEKDKFFSDAKRLVKDTFYDVGFIHQLPLFNIHLVFKASAESGIGKNGRAKNTAYRLYRPGNTMRAVMIGNRSAVQSSCNQAPDCDFGIVVANDPFYGGIDTGFATTTSSPTSGHIVLRHELGHTMGGLGEEYDGGQYFGANHAKTVNPLPWAHFQTAEGRVEAEPAKVRYIAWPWKNMAKGPINISFDSEEGYTKGSIYMSVSGLEDPDSATLTLDDKEVPFQNPDRNDRTFFSFSFDEGFGPGKHKLVLKENVKDNNNFLSSIQVNEYKDGYNFDNTYYGAYPNFQRGGAIVAYRPTHYSCMMRNMYSNEFCKACLENNWLKMLAKVSLIDSLAATKQEDSVELKVITQKIGQQRGDDVPPAGKLTVKWSHNGEAKPELNDSFAAKIPACAADGTWQATVEYVSDGIKHPKANQHTIDSANVSVAKQPGC